MLSRCLLVTSHLQLWVHMLKMPSRGGADELHCYSLLHFQGTPWAHGTVDECLERGRG